MKQHQHSWMNESLPKQWIIINLRFSNKILFGYSIHKDIRSYYAQKDPHEQITQHWKIKSIAILQERIKMICKSCVLLLIMYQGICLGCFKCYLNFTSSNSFFFGSSFLFLFLALVRVIKNPACDCPSQFYFISFLFRCVFFFFTFFLFYSFIFIVLYSNRAATTFFFSFCFFSSFFTFCYVCVCVCLAAVAASFFHHCWRLLFVWFTRCPSFIYYFVWFRTRKCIIYMHTTYIYIYIWLCIIASF